MMKDRFDFDKVGKRMPYTVPDGFSRRWRIMSSMG